MKGLIKMSKQQTVVRRFRPGFTLIELLVVVAIISVLAAILFPVFARARENARRASCMSNMKQIGLAFMMYTQDYDEQLPINKDPHPWDIDIAPYTGTKVQNGVSPAIFRCPSDTSADTRRSYAVPYNGAASGGLAKANFVFGWNDTLGIMQGVTLAAIQEPAATILMVEHPSTPSGMTSVFVNYFGGYTGSYVGGPTGTTGQDLGYPGHELHFDGWNYLFSDGHVKWIKPQQTLGGAASVVTKTESNLWVINKQ
jgi:prepilin-type N-terminal cleavage/methylation domain-containing protein/prepilin-type processing-associated H-X9-DG protein